MARAPIASASSVVPMIRVSDPVMGSACLKSRAFPAATPGVSSMRRTLATRPAAVSARATAPPTSPAPTIATDDMVSGAYYISPMTSLQDKVAIVTGGSRGIGRAIAEALLRHGAQVAITGTNTDHLRDAENALASAASGGARLLTFTADVRDHLAVESAIEETVRRLGGLDILVNNAGIGWFGTVESEPHEEWR